MRILHTADWHAGRNLKGIDRTPEIREALREVARLAIEERVDLILVSGDLYDKKNPGADAEATVYEFFLTTGQAGIPSVVIAGNHDAASRLDAASGMLGLANVRVLGEAKVAGHGGAFQIKVGDEVAQIAALPFVSERRIVRYAELLESDPGQWFEKYREGMRKLVANLTKPFDESAVNLLLMHTTMDGATLSHSEYKFHCTESYSLSCDMFPHSTNYVALGHIHKPQPVEGFPENAARYSGSIVQLDFGEEGDRKYVNILEAAPGKPTRVEEVEIRAGKPLRAVRIDLAREELDKRLMSLQDFDGWLKIRLKLDTPQPGLKDRIKTVLPNVLAVEFDFPEHERVETQGVDTESVELLEAYAQYYQAERGQDLPEDLRKAFRDLLEGTSEHVLEVV